MIEAGAILVGVAEREGGVYAADGLDLEALMVQRRETGTAMNFPGASNVESNQARVYSEKIERELTPAILVGIVG